MLVLMLWLACLALFLEQAYRAPVLAWHH